MDKFAGNDCGSVEACSSTPYLVIFPAGPADLNGLRNASGLRNGADRFHKTDSQITD